MLVLKKFILKTITLLIVSFFSISAWAEGRVYTIRTNSLSCDFCAYDLEQKFLKMKGVKEFEIDIDGVFLIKTDNTLKFEESVIKKLLLDNGFDYNGMTEKIQ